MGGFDAAGVQEPGTDAQLGDAVAGQIAHRPHRVAELIVIRIGAVEGMSALAAVINSGPSSRNGP